MADETKPAVQPVKNEPIVRRSPAKAPSDDPRQRLIDERKAREEANLKAMAEMDNAQPSPTQEENDLARLGIVKPDEEDKNLINYTTR